MYVIAKHNDLNGLCLFSHEDWLKFAYNMKEEIQPKWVQIKLCLTLPEALDEFAMLLMEVK